MLKSCKYCGKIHDGSIKCEARKRADQKRWELQKKSGAQKFRSTNGWTSKSIQIRKRDQYLCLCCRANLKGTITQYNTEDLSVHHITPIEEDYESRFDDLNLMTVCATHHEMCESGEISRDIQRELVLDSITRSCGTPVV